MRIATAHPKRIVRIRSPGRAYTSIQCGKERIRIAVVDQLPLPADVALREAALQAGLLGPGMIGLTLGYAVLIFRGHEAARSLVSHEFRHVHQYEAAGSIAAFLPAYLQQIIVFGYANAPFEADARAHEYPDT